MRLLVILLSLVLERYFSVRKALPNVEILEPYLRKIQPLLRRQSGPAAVFVFLFPLLLGFGLLYALLTQIFLGVLAWLVSLVTLLYCYRSLSFMQNPPEGEASLDVLFSNAHRNAFSVIFWFAVLGPVGALAYRLIERCAETASTDFPDLASATQHFSQLRAAFEWLPARATI